MHEGDEAECVHKVTSVVTGSHHLVVTESHHAQTVVVHHFPAESPLYHLDQRHRSSR